MHLVLLFLLYYLLTKQFHLFQFLWEERKRTTRRKAKPLKRSERLITKKRVKYDSLFKSDEEETVIEVDII